MDINVSDFFNKLAGALFKRKPKSGWGRNPYQDWKRILFGFVIATLLFALADAYIFYLIASGKIFADDVPNSGTAEMLKKADVESVAKIYSSKDEKISELRASRPVSIDPSL